MNNKSLDKIIFFIDLDNTLYESPYPYIFNEILREISNGTGKKREYIRALINIEFKHREKKDYISAFDWDDIISLICRKLGSKWEDSLKDYIDKYINEYGIKVFNGVETTINTLKKKHIRLYCTTNGHLLYQKPLIEATGLLSLFDDFLTSDNTGYIKSSIQFYKKKITKSDKVIVVGDSYKYDILYPNKFGFYTIWDVETILSKCVIEKYSNLKPRNRPSSMSFELTKYLEKHKNSIYSQTYKFKELPNAIIFNFSEIVSVLSYYNR